MTAARPIIIGGGITGLSAAYEFALAGRHAVLLEPRERLGGVIKTDSVEGCVLEAGPDSFLSAKPAGIELVKELGLGADLIGSNDKERVTYIVKQRRLVPMPDGLMMMVPTRILPIATSSLLSWSTKARMGLEYFRKPRTAPPPDRTVAEFIRSHYGQETVEYLAEPLLSGVYGGTADALSINSVLPRFVELERRYGSLTKGVLAMRAAAPKTGQPAAPLFQTLKGGLAQLTDELQRQIGGNTEIVRSAAETVEQTSGGFRVKAGNDWMETPSVLLACPAWQAGEVLRSLDGQLAEMLRGVDYSSSMTAAIGVNAASCGPIPAGHGFLVPRPERRRLVACTFVGAKFEHRVPRNLVVFRCFLGGTGNEAVLSLPDEQIIQETLQELEELLGWRPIPRFTRISRWPRSMAQYTVGHGARVEKIMALAEGYKGLALAGNAYDGIGIPDCIRTGRAAARTLLAR